MSKVALACMSAHGATEHTHLDLQWHPCQYAVPRSTTWLLTEQIVIRREELRENRKHPAMLAHYGLHEGRDPLEEGKCFVCMRAILQVGEGLHEDVGHVQAAAMQ